MKRIALIISVCALLFVSCNKKEIVILNSANPQYNLGIIYEDEGNEQIITMQDVNSLRYGEIGTKLHDTLVAAKLKPVNAKLVTLSKDGKVLDEVLEHKSCGDKPYIKVYDKIIDLELYTKSISCEHIAVAPTYSYNNLIFYMVDIFGKKETDNKNYALPIALMINTTTKECSVVGTGTCIDGKNVQIFDDKYFKILDLYMDSFEYIYKFYDKEGNYIGWSQDIKGKVIYTTPLKTTNSGWLFIYGNDKYGRPIAMKNLMDKSEMEYTDIIAKYDIKYTNTGYHIFGYDWKDRKVYDYELKNSNDFMDLRSWDMKFNRGGILIKYKFDLSEENTLSSVTYYNKSQTYYMYQSRHYDNTPKYEGIFKNTYNSYYKDKCLIEVDIFSETFLSKEKPTIYTKFYSPKEEPYPIYQIDPNTGEKKKIASLPEYKMRKFLLDYLYSIE